MTTPFLNLSPRQHGLAEPHCKDIQLLDQMLGSVLLDQHGKDLLDLARKLYHASREENPLTLLQRFPELNDPKTVQRITRAYTVLFQLLNLAEQKEIVRVNRKRQAEANVKPRKESILETMQSLKDDGVDAQTLQSLLDRLDICPTLTAHPTEARRRAVLDKMETVANLLVEYSLPADQPSMDQPLNRKQQIEGDLLRMLTSLWLTEELSLSPVTVEDEVQNAIYFIEHTIFDVAAWLHHDLQDALRNLYPDSVFSIPPFLKYRSWVGGDRDGNPKVTPDVSWETLLYHKRKALRLYIQRVTNLLREFTQSARLLPAHKELTRSLQRDALEVRVSPRLMKRYQAEPYARKLLFIRARLSSTLKYITSLGKLHTVGEIGDPPVSAYTHSDMFLKDLDLIGESLAQSQAQSFAYQGSLADLMIQVKTFGFHLMALDMRQHSEEHEKVLEEIFSAIQMIPDGRLYSELREEEKINLLTDEMFSPRPLLPRDWQGSTLAKNVFGVFEVMRHALRLISSHSVSSYIISMTHTISDILEVLVLAKDAGLVRWVIRDGQKRLVSDIDVVPLFETIDDLSHCDRLMQELFDNQVYRLQLQARENYQEIMLGYSDSSKDGGYMSANWKLHHTQGRLTQLCEKQNVELRLFHGRGGTVGRGGGRAYLAIRAQSYSPMNTRIRFTEQGEIISFRYSYSPIAHRHLEQIVGAVLLASNPMNPLSGEDTEWSAGMESMAELSRKVYRDLIYNNDDFWEFYIQATPIAYISQLPIASRPVSRQGGSMVGMEDLRAIPWVFAWVQSRYLVPGWYGIGSALEWYCQQSEGHLEQMKEMYRSWPFFSVLLNNAQVELNRVHLRTAYWYAARVQPRECGEAIHAQIEEEYRKTCYWIKEITEDDDCFAKAGVVKRTVELRNPIVEPMNELQVALLEICNREDTNLVSSHDWKEAMLLSLAGIAAAMQSTG